MTIDQEGFGRFFAWLQAFDSNQVENEGEVRAKFIVRLFDFLSYPESCSRPDFPLKAYEPGRRGRKPEIDLLYFSTGTREQQTADTSLVLIETKEPRDTHLEDALTQSRFYAYHLKPLFLVVTNAHRLLVLKQLDRREEEIFNISIEHLRLQEVALRMYHQLHFEVVKRLKEQLSDGLTHALYVDLIHMVDLYPNLHAQMAKGDFVRFHAQVGRKLTVIEPKVSVVCELPLVFGEGACHIEFSNLMLRGLTCHLTHQQILTTLMLGLETSPEWNTRRFLRTIGQENFEAQLGQTTVTLSAQEAKELCACLDVICHAYRTIIVDAENILETWDYQPMRPQRVRMHGFHILSVQPWLWTLLHRFAHEFDAFSGQSYWHMFDRSHEHIRVIHDHMQEAVLISPFYNLAAGEVDLIYCIDDDRYVEHEEQRTGHSWKQDVGPSGRWTARHTEQWVINTFISYVIDYYEQEQAPYPIEVPYWPVSSTSESPVLPVQMSQSRELTRAVHQIQHWLHEYRGGYQIAAKVLRPYYRALIQVV